MVDRISGNKGFSPLTHTNRSGKTGEAKKTDAAKSSDRVDFSAALQNATRSREVTVTQESARAEKIQALKAQIQDGTYQPDLEKVASSLLPFIMEDV
jgi:negative regulator of flagellin synthesis FlgM